MKLTLDPGAAALLDALHAAGYAAYAVGGCVRDSLLGRTAHDWDLCTSALPQQVMELFGTEQCILGKPLLRLTHRPQQTVLQVFLPAKGVYQPLGCIIRHSVDGKIPP